MLRRTTLVTGGAGFIGSHVVDSLIERGHQVTVLDDLSGGFRDNVSEAANFVQGSITDVALVDALFAEQRFDYVLHLAAYAAEGLSHFIRRFNYTNNLIGSTNLINAAVRYRVRCFVFTSSIAVYGAGQLPMREETTPQPEDPYGIAKYAVELDLAAAHHHFGLDYIIFRPHNVYGERQNIGDRYRNVIGIFMNQVMQGRPCTIFGDGSQTRAFTHISEIAPVIAQAAEQPAAFGGVFNLGADTPYTINELAHSVQVAMGRRTGTSHLEARNEVAHAYSDHSKAHAMFGRPQSVLLEEGLSRMAEWAWRVGPRHSTEFGDLELEEGLPPSWSSSADVHKAAVGSQS
jgi:UDP-glucose 4-epimerase